ncbi:unnamed protein product, partial [Hapterophycus canaliculatus]
PLPLSPERIAQYLVRCLGRKDLLPAIVFIFSRAGCDQAAKQVSSRGRD